MSQEGAKRIQLSPIMIDSTLLDLAAVSPDKAIRLSRNDQYPIYHWYFLVAIIAVIGCFQFSSFILANYCSSNARESCIPNGHVSIRKLPSALVNAYRIIVFRSTISFIPGYTLNVAEIGITCLYIISVLSVDFIGTTDLSGNKLTLNYWSNRSGVLAASQIPLIAALGTKNNIISAVTLVSADKLNYLHRMSGRMLLVLIFIHIGARAKQGLGEDLYEAWLHAGIAAVVALTILCIVSLRPIRTRQYEMFFYIHLFMVVIMMITIYYHLREFRFDRFIWPAFIIWGLDRLLRGLRVLAFYFNLNLSTRTKVHSTAKTELLTSHCVRVTIPRPSNFHWSSGQTAYLILPGVSNLPFEAHPFSIVSKKGDDSLVFLVSVRKGFTRRLADTAAQNGIVTALVDGPYGASPDLRRFDTTVFVAGGSGVSYTLPRFLEILEKVKHKASRCKRVLFIWALRDLAHVEWISEVLYEALRNVPEGLDVEVKIFVTGSSGSEQWDGESTDESMSQTFSSEKVDEKKEKNIVDLLSELPSFGISQGRGDLSDILLAEANRMMGGHMSVDVCGSASLTMAVRSSLGFEVSGLLKVLRGGTSVSLHAESFGN
ncbi:ferric reductase NAD binding domain-containing protein [Mycena floridula]|nr:ferric reductase NAD binding domain-containing protein [Mycena floridula]